MNYQEACKVLDVSTNDSLESIKKSYLKRVKFYHPDQYQDNDKKEYAEELTKRMNEAWEYIQEHYGTEVSEFTNNNDTQYEDMPNILTYTVPVYKPIFTKKTVIVTLIVVAIIAYIVFSNVVKNVMRNSLSNERNGINIHNECCDDITAMTIHGTDGNITYYQK